MAILPSHPLKNQELQPYLDFRAILALAVAK